MILAGKKVVVVGAIAYAFGGLSTKERAEVPVEQGPMPGPSITVAVSP
jgi:hypothetical protein